MAVKNKKGKIIVFDGPDGSGKGTALSEIKKIFKDVAWFSREPGGTPHAEALRSVALSDLAKGADALTQFLTMWASRRDHVTRGIAPQIEKGKHVILDRADSSTWAYQIFGQDGTTLRKIFSDMRSHVFGKYKPSLYVIFKVDTKVAMARKKAQLGEDRNHYDSRDAAFHKRTMDGYLDFVKKMKVPHVIIDASKSIEEVKEQCLKALKKVLK
ncbi:MAG: dTMP kinase [bacterium]